jgi:hypothetical protein
MWPITLRHMAKTFDCMGAAIFHCRQFRYLESEPLHSSLLSQQTTVRLFFAICTLNSQVAMGQNEKVTG